MSEVHATWMTGGKPLCGVPGSKTHGGRVVIVRPADWERISCAACHYTATGDRT